MATPLGMWDLSSPTRNKTILPTSGAQSLIHWMAWEVPGSFQFSPVPQSCPTLCNPMDCMQYARLPCPSPAPEACSNSCPLNWWCHPTISFSVVTFSNENHVNSMGHFIFDKNQKKKTIQQRKEDAFNVFSWDSWIPRMGKLVTVNPYFLTPCTKVTWRWLTDLNIKAKTIKFLEENVNYLLN